MWINAQWWQITGNHSTQRFVKSNCPRLSEIPNFSYFQVCTEGRLTLECTFDDMMRIKVWHMAVRSHRELIPRNVVGMHQHSNPPDPALLEQLTKNITRQGITNSTLNYLRVSGDIIDCFGRISHHFLLLFFWFQLCVILEPMQELMSRHKAYALSPRDCLKTTLFQKWQRMVAPPGKRGTIFIMCNSLKFDFVLLLLLFHHRPARLNQMSEF